MRCLHAGRLCGITVSDSPEPRVGSFRGLWLSSEYETRATRSSEARSIVCRPQCRHSTSGGYSRSACFNLTQSAKNTARDVGAEKRSNRDASDSSWCIVPGQAHEELGRDVRAVGVYEKPQ